MPSKALQAMRDGQCLGQFSRLAQPSLEQRLAALEENVAQLSAQVIGFAQAAETIPAHESVSRIKRVVAAHYRVPVSSLVATTRWEEAVWARHVAMELCLTLLHLAPLRIGLEFKRGRGSVIHARNAVNALLATDVEAARQYGICRSNVETTLKEP